jgi:hypothetical protein
LTTITSYSGYSKVSTDSMAGTIDVSSLYAAATTLTGIVKRDDAGVAQSSASLSCRRTLASTAETTASTV